MHVLASSFDQIRNVMSSESLSSPPVEMDSLVSSFSQQATDWRQLVAMSVGSFAFQGMRALAVAAKLGNIFSSGLALGTEAAAFEGVNRSLRNQGEISGSFFENWKRDVVHFGMIKGVGRVLATQNVFFRHGVSSLGMMWGSDATAKLGWTPREDDAFVQRFVHGMAMSLSLEVGTQAFGLMSGRVLQRISQSLERRAEFAQRCRVSLVEEPRFVATWRMSSEESPPRVLADRLSPNRAPSQHPIKRMVNGLVFGSQVGSVMGLFAGAVIGGVCGFVSFSDVLFSGGSFWINGALLMLATALGATMGIFMGSQFGGGMGTLIGVAVTARAMMLESRKKISHDTALGASYREIPALGVEEFSQLEKLLEDSQIPFSEKLKSLHDLPDTLDAEGGQCLLNILRRRLRYRSTENKDLPEDAVDLALFTKIGRQPKSCFDSMSAEYAATAAHLMPLVVEYGMSQGKTGGEVLGEINPHFLAGSYRRFLTLLLMANPLSYRSRRVEKAFSYLHLFGLALSTTIPIYPFLLLMSLPVSSLNLIATQDLMEPHPRHPPNQAKPDLEGFEPEFLEALKLFHEIFMKKPDGSEVSIQEALTYLRVVAGGEAPSQRSAFQGEEDEVELERLRRLRAAGRTE